MRLKSSLINLASRLDVHISRSRTHPSRTLLGLKRYNIGTIIDVGANTGQFARSMKAHFPTADILCFEPLPEPYRALSSWAARTQGVVALNVALGDRSGTQEMLFHTDHSASSSFLKTTKHSESTFSFTASQRAILTKMERLDDFISARSTPLRREIMLKLDVQGFELHVLRGAASLLETVRAVIVEVILDELYQNQTSFVDIVSIMKEGGLVYSGNLDQVVAHDGHVMWLDAVFVRKDTGS